MREVGRERSGGDLTGKDTWEKFREKRIKSRLKNIEIGEGVGLEKSSSPIHRERNTGL
jgi:hypothetical protein